MTLDDYLKQRKHPSGISPVSCPPGRHPLGCPHTAEERAAKKPTWLERMVPKDLTRLVVAR